MQALFLEFSLLLYMEGKLTSGKRQVADFIIELMMIGFPCYMIVL